MHIEVPSMASVSPLFGDSVRQVESWLGHVQIPPQLRRLTASALHWIKPLPSYKSSQLRKAWITNLLPLQEPSAFLLRCCFIKTFLNMCNFISSSYWLVVSLFQWQLSLTEWGNAQEISFLDILFWLHPFSRNKNLITYWLMMACHCNSIKTGTTKELQS